MSSELRYYLVKLNDIEKQLGGNSALNRAQKGKSKDAFLNGEIMIHEIIKTVQKKQNDRDERLNLDNGKRDVGTITMSSDIREQINNLKTQISNLERELIIQEKKKKYKDIEAKRKRLQDYKTHLKIFEGRERGNDGPLIDEAPPPTIEQLQLQMKNDSTKEDLRWNDDDLTAQEHEGLKGFAEKDKKIDALAGEIDDQLTILGVKVDNMSTAIDQTSVQVQINIKEVEKTSLQLGLTNKKLKELVAAYRSPNKFCLDMVCILLLLGLAAVIYNMVKGQSS